MKQKAEVTPGQRYTNGNRLRWVLAIAGDYVIYSRGGDRHYECLVRTLKRWARKAELVQ